jgi:putative hydrolase of the HAD superfamily
VRAWIVAHPESTDLERLPLFLDTILRHLGVASAPDRRAAAARVAEEHRRSNLWSRPTAGASETLSALRGRGYRLAVVSNADGRVRTLLDKAQLASFLDCILDSAEIGIEKPDRRIFLAAAEKLGLPASSCAYVGDIYEIDILGARGAGLYPILIGDCPAKEPVERISVLEELLDIFTGVEVE